MTYLAQVEGMLEIVVPVAIFLVLISLGLIVGRLNERRHLADLDRREQELAYMPVTDLQSMPGAQPHGAAVLVMGEAVIATDYLKAFQAKLRNVFGGELRSYETLMNRARREAILRMLEDARSRGYNAVCNLRLETSDIGGAASNAKKGATMVESLAYGTAYLLPAQAPPS